MSARRVAPTIGMAMSIVLTLAACAIGKAAAAADDIHRRCANERDPTRSGTPA